MPIHTFKHDAMATSFEVHINHPDPAYSAQAATALWEEIDNIELLLSLFNESSDISRINTSPPGTILPIHETTHQVLLLAQKLTPLTLGTFDITLGTSTAQLRKTTQGGARSPSAPSHATNITGTSTISNGAAAPSDYSLPTSRYSLLDGGSAAALTIDPQSPLVQINAPTNLDLGAIGKGHALDTAAKLLADWELPNVLLNAGNSSLLALGNSPDTLGWSITITPDTGISTQLTLAPNTALGSSGTSQQSAHILNPRTGNTTYTHHRTWCIAPTAAEADALSTAFMLLTPDEITKILHRLGPQYRAILEHPQTHQLLHLP